MDNQPPIVPNNSGPAQNPTPVAPSVQATPVVTNNGGSKSKMMIIVISLVVVLVALVAGGAYYYMNMQQSQTPPPPAPITSQPTTQVTPTKTPSPEDQVNAVSVDDGATDFAAIDKDLQSL